MPYRSRAMRALTLAALLGCGGGASAPIGNTSRAPAVAAFPCGVAALYELSPYDVPRCPPSGLCRPGPMRRAVGSCSVVPSSLLDLHQGRGRLSVMEAGRPIVSSDPPPHARTVVFDPRSPTPGDVRVGMTGADLERLVPPFTTIQCRSDDVGWPGQLRCHLGKPSDPECDAVDASGVIVVFEPGAQVRDPISGAAAQVFVRARRVVAIDLGADCGDD